MANKSFQLSADAATSATVTFEQLIALYFHGFEPCSQFILTLLLDVAKLCWTAYLTVKRVP